MKYNLLVALAILIFLPCFTGCPPLRPTETGVIKEVEWIDGGDEVILTFEDGRIGRFKTYRFRGVFNIGQEQTITYSRDEILESTLVNPISAPETKPKPEYEIPLELKEIEDDR